MRSGLTLTLSPPEPRQYPSVVRFAGKLFTRGPAVALRHWRLRVLRSAYRRGNSRPARKDLDERTDPVIVETGRMLREQLIAANARRHAHTGYRVLMFRPNSLTAEIWFGDLAQCMQHAGIESRVLPPDTPTAAINAAFEDFRPNVFIATESTQSLRVIDLAFVERYKRDHGCLRLLIPVWHARSPREHVPSGRSTHEEDEWRRQLRFKGLTADVHFSIFEREFHERFSHDPGGPAIDYVVIPQGSNPFTDFPVDAARQYDYFMATSMTEERVEVSYRYLRPILRRYRGLWAGARWGFGNEAGIPPAQMPLCYSQSRIALSPLVGFVHHYGAEVTHRVYAAAACGAFQLTTPTSITNRYFRPDELVQAASAAEYVRLYDHYVSRPAARNAVAMAALRRVYGEHTCFHRIDKLVDHCDAWRRAGLF
jgi:hypothetical protein